MSLASILRAQGKCGTIRSGSVQSGQLNNGCKYEFPRCFASLVLRTWLCTFTMLSRMTGLSLNDSFDRVVLSLLQKDQYF